MTRGEAKVRLNTIDIFMTSAALLAGGIYPISIISHLPTSSHNRRLEASLTDA